MTDNKSPLRALGMCVSIQPAARLPGVIHMDLDMTRRDRLRRRTVVAAVGVGLLCGAYLLPRVAQAVTRRADPLSLKLAAKSTLGTKSSTLAASSTSLAPATDEPLIVVPDKRRHRTPHKPPAPKPPPYHRPGPPSGLSFT